MQTVSVGEIAEKVKRPGEALQTAIDRVKNWAKEGLIKPVGDKNPGSGRARRYAKKSLIDAVLIQTLVNAGLTATNAAWVVKSLIRNLETVGTDPRTLVAYVGIQPNGKRWYSVSHVDDLHRKLIENDTPTDALTIIYVNKILERMGED
jgi:hypothetical protein